MTIIILIVRANAFLVTRLLSVCDIGVLLVSGVGEGGETGIKVYGPDEVVYSGEAEPVGHLAYGLVVSGVGVYLFLKDSEVSFELASNYFHFVAG